MAVSRQRRPLTLFVISDARLSSRPIFPRISWNLASRSSPTASARLRGKRSSAPWHYPEKKRTKPKRALAPARHWRS